MKFTIQNCLILVLFKAFLVIITVGAKNASQTLELVHVLYRHGDRGPIKFYPNDPYKNDAEKYWPRGLGQLTKRGKSMEYQLGKWLRKRYKDFVSPVFVTDEVYIRSSDYDRTLMSAECVLAAFYYPNNDTKFDDRIWWIPTPVHTSPAEVDKLINVDRTCRGLSAAQKEAGELPEVKKFMKENEKLLNFVSEKSGAKVNSVGEAQHLFDLLMIETLSNLTLPMWAKQSYDKLEKVADFWFKLSTITKELKRLRGGPLVSEITDHMKQKSEGKMPERKLFMYSAHDLTVSVLLNSIGAFNDVSPPYASTVLLELHRVEGEFVVRLFYQNDSTLASPANRLVIPGCDMDCPLDKWTTLLADVIPEDWDRECAETEKKSWEYFYFLLFSGLFYATAISSVLVVAWLALRLVGVLGPKGSRDRRFYEPIKEPVVLVH